MKTIDKKFLAAVILITVGVIFRLLQWTPNFSPVTAIALFGGACLLDKKWSLIIPLVSLFIGDVLLALMNHYPVFHDTILFVYGAFLLIVLLGWQLRNGDFSNLKVGGFAVLSSVLFFFISNFGVWAVGTLYPPTWEGLIACFTMAIPFYKFTLLGDVVYTIIFFGIYQLVTYTANQVSTESLSR
jgi:hypothetical protein